MLLLLAALVVLLVVLYFWASGGAEYTDGPTPGIALKGPGTVAASPAGGPGTLSVMSFNIGYGRGPAGDESGPWTRAHIEQHLDGIAAQIQAANVDIAALQEVDIAAERSHDIDQASLLLQKLGWGHGSCVVTWQKNHVPFPYWPPSRHYGRMKSGSCLLSRFPVVATTRLPLPQPDQSFWRNAFYFQRSIDQVELDVGGQRWVVFNVHLEAFDTPNREAQAVILREAVKQVGHPRVLVIGDFNTIPDAMAKRTGFADEPEMDFTGDRTLAESFAGLAFSDAFAADPNAFTFPADAPTRRLDYIFHTTVATPTEARVLTGPPGPWSDHLPLVARFRLSPQP
jgi:endonuclease/exonuclease/phosphatase family metal-dependent hydrolase